MRGLVALIALSGGCDSVFGLDSVNLRAGVPVFVDAVGVAQGTGDAVPTIDVPLGNATRGDLIVVAICEEARNGVMGISDDNQSSYTNLPIGAATPGLESSSTGRASPTRGHRSPCT